MSTQLSQQANLIMQKLKLASLNGKPSGVKPFLDEAPHALRIKAIGGKNNKNHDLQTRWIYHDGLKEAGRNVF